jgi:hypothetical protein
MFRKVILSVIVVAISLTVFACSDQKSSFLEEKITKDNLSTIAKQIMDETVMSKEDAALFNSAVNRLGLTPDSILGKTVGELIANENSLAQKNVYDQMFATLTKAEILMKHKIKYLGLKAFDTLDKSYDYLVFEVTNTSDKNIASVDGQLRFFNSSSQLVKAYPIELSKVMPDANGLKPNETRRFVYPFFHDKTNQRDEIIRNAKDLQVLWFPMSLTFTDKTKLNSVNEPETAQK